MTSAATARIVGRATPLVFLVLFTFLETASSAKADCLKFNIETVDVSVCGDNGDYEVRASWAGVPLHTLSLQNHYNQYTDESFTEFSVPGVAGAGIKVAVRILRIARNNHTIFSDEGDVIWGYMNWNVGSHPPDCIVFKTGDLGSHCWDDMGGGEWKKLGNL
jgi:hypothetical protein